MSRRSMMPKEYMGHGLMGLTDGPAEWRTDGLTARLRRRRAGGGGGGGDGRLKGGGEGGLEGGGLEGGGLDGGELGGGGLAGGGLVWFFPPDLGAIASCSNHSKVIMIS